MKTKRHTDMVTRSMGEGTSWFSLCSLLFCMYCIHMVILLRLQAGGI